MGPLYNSDTRSRYAAGVKTEVAIAQVREEIAALCAYLVQHGHIGAIGGAVSSRVAGTELFVISPPWTLSDELAPQDTILCDVNGEIVPSTPGSENASSTYVATHAYVYANKAEVGGIVHSQSPYAASWAAAGTEIPCVLPVMADEFGGVVPVATTDDEIGRTLHAALVDHSSPAVLVQGQGAFSTGPAVRDAVRSAVLLEDVARIAHLTTQITADRR